LSRSELFGKWGKVRHGFSLPDQKGTFFYPEGKKEERISAGGRKGERKKSVVFDLHRSA